MTVPVRSSLPFSSETSCCAGPSSILGVIRSARRETFVAGYVVISDMHYSLRNMLCMEALSTPSSENELALGDTTRSVPRLRRFATSAIASRHRQQRGQLILGGTGGLGLLTARWLAHRKADRLVLSSRSGMLACGSPEETNIYRQIDCATCFELCDSAERSGIDRLVSATLRGGAILDGVWHAAGVLNDSLVFKQSSSTLTFVSGAKACGGYLLSSALVPVCKQVLAFCHHESPNM